MKKFVRRFAVEAVESHIGNPHSLISTLFSRWVLPGNEGPDGPLAPVRLALRDGYVNFYGNGQSVAKLSTPRGRPRIEVASKYLLKYDGDFRPSREKHGVTTIEGESLLLNDPAGLLDHMLCLSEGHCGDEKRFVEHLLAANPHAIEVEMALPGDPDFVSCMEHRQDKRVAPRMDLVVAHEDGDQRTVIDFWEVKMAFNGELRATLPEDGGQAEPHLCQQLADYESWIQTLPHRRKQVREAYQKTGETLEKLAIAAGKPECAARAVWRALSKGEPSINPRPGIVIGNYDPRTGQHLPIADSFAPHCARLTMHEDGLPCFTVREVKSRACPNLRIDTPLPGNRL